METVNAFGSGIVKTMAAGIGFVSEGASSYKEKKLEKYSSDKGSIGKAVRMLRPPSQQHATSRMSERLPLPVSM